ncbi:seipin-2-like [Ananas comosus]|uniref:Seipin n=1 Tax=Ananas comosus TaxID=4615 RepID=A0A199VKH2_ANACO|nr:seipin-2-like [Ananas comosus]OAY77376.1 Seipin [Ananas comosus]
MEPSDPDPDPFFDAMDDPDPEPFFDAPDELPPSDPSETLAPATPSAAVADTPPPPSTLRRRRSRLDGGGERRRSGILRLVNVDGASDYTADHAPAPSSTLTSERLSSARDRFPRTPLESAATSALRDAEPSPDAAAAAPPRTLLECVAGFVIRAVLFQLNLVVNCITFPICLLHCSFLLVIDPFGSIRRYKDHMRARVSSAWKILLDKAASFAHERLGSQRELWGLAVRLIIGGVWAFYICFVLCGLLATAFLGGSWLAGKVLEKPIQLTEELNFDYTKASPVALVPVISCSNVFGSEGKGRAGAFLDRRMVPANHKLQLTISLTLPESDYNRNLGVFQVRVEFLSAEGKVIFSSRQPCMLRFKSSHMHIIETFLKSGSLLAGYSSESQTLRLKMRGFTEKPEPTACIRVILEQRAEFKPGAGIPEIYTASLKLESELPLFKRIIWNWRRTLLMWLSMGIFIFELLILLVCCRPVIIPRTRSPIAATGRS